MDDIIGRRKAEYEPLIEDFKKEISGLNLQNVTGPHFPCVGECYEMAKYKFAFCGIETYGWFLFEDLMKQDVNSYLVKGDKRLNAYGPIEWIGNKWNTAFWAFVFKFLAKFYNTDLDKLIQDESDKDSRSILKSVVWGNSNSIERFEVASKANGADFNVWEKVKRASIRFDNLTHIINFCAPKVVFVVCSVDDRYIVNDEFISHIHYVNDKQKNNFLKLNHDNPKYTYYYLRNSDTHVFKLPHPRWQGQFSGIGQEAYVDSLIEAIKGYRIWDTLPSSNKDWKTDNGNHIDQNQLIASIAHALTCNNAVMYGKNIGELFNYNGILTQYGTQYSGKGGKGIFKTIKSAYDYYHKINDFQSAYEIARSFVDINGDYAYDKD